MNKSRELKEAIEKLSGNFLKDRVSIVLCKVDSVDENTQTCDVTPIGGDATTNIPAVNLTAEANDGWLLIPKVGSTVMVTYSTRNIAFVSMFSDIEKVLLVAGTSIQYNDGSYDGLARVQELTTKLNNLENDLNNIKQAFASWVVVPNDGGAALKAISATWFAQMFVPTQQSEIENTKITHGI